MRVHAHLRCYAVPWAWQWRCCGVHRAHHELVSELIRSPLPMWIESFRLIRRPLNTHLHTQAGLAYPLLQAQQRAEQGAGMELVIEGVVGVIGTCQRGA